MYRYPIDQDKLGSMKLVATGTAEFNGEVSMRDGKPVRTCDVLVTPPDERPEVMQVSIPHEGVFSLPEMTLVRFTNLTVRGRVTQRGQLAYNIEADDMIEVADGPREKTSGPASMKPLDPKPLDSRPLGLK